MPRAKKDEAKKPAKKQTKAKPEKETAVPKPVKPAGPYLEELKIKTETYYALQKMRIQAQLRIGAFVKAERLDDYRSSSLHYWLDEYILKMEKAIKAEVEDLLKTLPIWERWLKDVPGIGPCLAGSLAAGIADIARFDSISGLWSYSGLGVRDGEAPRRKAGEQANWSPFLRTTAYKISDSFIKQNPEKSQYRGLHDDKKAIYLERFEPHWHTCNKCGSQLIERPKLPDKCSKAKCSGNQGGIPHPTRKTKDGKPFYRYNKLHIHNMAKRYAVKIFLQHFWVAWRTIENLSVSSPWVLEHGGHVDYIESDIPIKPGKKTKKPKKK